MLKINKSLKAKNLRSGRLPVAGIILHDTAGSGQHGDTLYLVNDPDGRGVSVDFTIERDGSIYQLNPDLEKFYTSHAGRATVFRIPGRKYLNRDVTRACIGIELCQKANMSLSPVWPDEQVKAAAELCVSLCRKFGLAKDRVTTHRGVITDGSRTDPRNFPFDTFWFHFNRAAGIPAIDTPGDGLNDTIIHDVKAGETLWKIARDYRTTIEDIKSRNDINEASNVIRPGQKLLIKK
jgi:N-acetyl-anhydromuramyl-L-alanine amidase AmpD